MVIVMISNDSICVKCAKKDNCNIYFNDKICNNVIINRIICKSFQTTNIDMRWEIIEIIAKCPKCSRRVSFNEDGGSSECPHCGALIKPFDILWR